MRLFRGRGAALPAEVAGALELGPGDRALAWSQDAATKAYVVASLHALHHVPGRGGDGAGGSATSAAASAASAAPAAPAASAAATAAAPAALGASGAARWSRPWLDVAAGAWEPKTRTITVTWADQGRPAMWSFEDPGVTLPSVLHERVRASVLVAVPVQMGERDLGRVALRKDLATGALVEQVSLRRGSAGRDPDVAAYVQVLLRDLREQAGL